MLAENKGRMALLSDEGGVFDLMGGRYSNQIPNLDVYLKAHAGSYLKVDRGSRPPVAVPRPALTIGISPQPSVLMGLASKPGFRGRGLLARFQFVVIPSNLGTRTGETRPLPDDVRERYAVTMEAILEASPAKDPNGEECPFVLTLSSEAFALWREFERQTEPTMGPGGAFEHLADWAGKLPGAVARIAALLHIARHAKEGPESREVGQDDMAAAIRIAEVLKARALVAFGMMDRKPELDDARKVLEWIKQTGKREFSFRDCHQAHRSRFPRADDLKPAIAVLEERGFIRPKDTVPVPHRPSKMYDVNPHAL